MVKKVAVPARSSVVKLEFLSVNLNRLPTQLLATAEFSRFIRPGCDVVSISMIRKGNLEMGKMYL